MSVDPADLEVLRGIPQLLLRFGYVDACAVRGALHLSPAIAGDLEVLGEPLRPLMALWFLGREVAPQELEPALAPADIDALVRLGVLVRRGSAVASGGLLAVPLLGQVAFIPGAAYLGEETASLLTRLSAPPGARCLVLVAGPGLIALRAAAAARVVAVEADPVTAACAELNLVMNRADSRAEVRNGLLYDALRPGERFDLVAAALPVLPFAAARTRAAAYAGIDGPELARRTLLGLPQALDDNGVAQLAAVWHGDEAGPRFGLDLEELAAIHGLRIAVTLPARQPLGPGSPLFEAFATQTARVSGDAAGVRRAQTEHLRTRGSTHLYLSAITVTRSSRPGVVAARHYLEPGGSWVR